MDAVLDYAERRTRACIAALDDGDARGRRRARGAPTATSSCALAATVDGDELHARLHRLAPPSTTGNLNCPLAVTRSACYFAVRVLTDPDIPPSAGAYRPITVIAPEGSLLNAQRPGRRRRAATSRPPRASPTSCWRRSAARSGRAR